MGAGTSRKEDVFTAAGRDDHQAHGYKQKIVVPPIARFSPEPGVPDKDLLLDGAQHDQDEAGRRQLRQDSERHSQAAGQLSKAEKPGEARTYSDALSASDGILGVAPAAGDEDQGHE